MSEENKLPTIEVPEDHKVLEDHIKRATEVLALTLNQAFGKFNKHKNVDYLIMEASLALAMASEIRSRLSSRGTQLIDGVSSMILDNIKRSPELDESKLIALPGILNGKKGLS